MNKAALRRRTCEILEASGEKDTLGHYVDVFLMLLIGLNVAAIVLQSVYAFEQRFSTELFVFEVFSVIIFTMEYAARVWSSVESPKHADMSATRARIRYALSPMALIDIAAIAPFYLAFVLPMDLRFLRVVRLLRVFKFTRYSPAMQALLAVLQEESKSFAAAFSVLFVLLVLAASGIYLIERDVQPVAFGSIPAAMWWAMTTLTTVGYGDVTPMTPGGKMFGGLITLIGMGMVALPAGILASGFTEQLQRRRKEYAQLLDNAMAQGIDNEDEAAALEASRIRLGLSSEEGRSIWESLQKQRATQRHCPHCGQSL